MNTNEFLNSLNELTRQSAGLSKSLQKASTQNFELATGISKTNATQQDVIASNKKFSDAIQNTTGNVLSFADSLMNGNGSFAPLTAIVTKTAGAISAVASKFPGLGTFIAGFGKASAQVTNYMIESFDKAYGTFEKISDVGVIASFTDMKKAADGMRLSYASTQNVLTKNSRTLALLGGSATKGTEELMRVVA
jgi:predicted choloylglycine hydrolase